MDNLNTHNGSSFYEAFEPQETKRILDKLEIHYTPQAEIELSHLSRQCLNRHLPNKEILECEVLAWTDYRHNENSNVDSQFTPEKARIKLKHLYPALKPS